MYFVPLARIHILSQSWEEEETVHVPAKEQALHSSATRLSYVPATQTWALNIFPLSSAGLLSQGGENNTPRVGQ
jgi:hypothetical protein